MLWLLLWDVCVAVATSVSFDNQLSSGPHQEYEDKSRLGICVYVRQSSYGSLSHC